MQVQTVVYISYLSFKDYYLVHTLLYCDVILDVSFTSLKLVHFHFLCGNDVGNRRSMSIEYCLQLGRGVRGR